MTGFFSRVTQRAATALSVVALATGLTVMAPTQAKAVDWGTAAAVAVGVALIGIVAGGGTRAAKPQQYTVIARYCENKHTGLYYRC